MDISKRLVMQDFTLLNQQVDTLKLHLYPTEMKQDDFTKYKQVLESLKLLKAEAQKIRATNNDVRFVQHTFNTNHKFQVMASTVSGFAVTIVNADVSISIKDIGKLPVTNPTIKIEFRSSYLTINGYKKAISKVLDFIDNNIIKNYTLKVSEIHLCADIQGYEFSIFDVYRLKTRSRLKVAYSDDDQEYNQNSIFFNGTHFNSFRFGSSNYLLRIYNKSLELEKFKDGNELKMLKWESNPYYNPAKTVWRIEFQIRRAKLKTMYSEKNGILDGFENVLNSISDIWSRCMSDFILKDIEDSYVIDMMRGYKLDSRGKQKLLTKYGVTKKFQRAHIIDFWSQISNFNGFIAVELHTLKRSELSEKYSLKNQIKGVFSLFFKTHYDNATPDNLIKIIQSVEDEILEKRGFGLVDYGYTKALDTFDKTMQVREWYGIPTDNISQMKIHLERVISSSIYHLWENEPTQTAISEYTMRGVINERQAYV